MNIGTADAIGLAADLMLAILAEHGFPIHSYRESGLHVVANS